MAEDRIEDLEVRMSFLESDLRALDGVLRETADALARLSQEVRALREQHADGAAQSDLRADVPPHHANFRG